MNTNLFFNDQSLSRGMGKEAGVTGDSVLHDILPLLLCSIINDII